MKDFLESLEIGEGKIKLSKDEIKSILAEHGKSITTETDKVKNELTKENDDLKNTINELKEQVNKAPSSNELESLKSKIAEYEQKETARKEAESKAEQDKILNANILEAIEGKEFVNDRTKNAIVNEIKTALQDKANMGKSAKDIFETITKDSTDVFKNPNELNKDMADIKNVDINTEKNTSENSLKLNPMFRQY